MTWEERQKVIDALQRNPEHLRQIEESEAAIERGDLGEPVFTRDLVRHLRGAPVIQESTT